VAGVLLDPVNQDLPHCDAVLADPLAQILVLGQCGIGRRLLAVEVG
jgi:hypothetical protein